MKNKNEYSVEEWKQIIENTLVSGREKEIDGINFTVLFINLPSLLIYIKENTLQILNQENLIKNYNKDINSLLLNAFNKLLEVKNEKIVKVVHARKLMVIVKNLVRMITDIKNECDVELSGRITKEELINGMLLTFKNSICYELAKLNELIDNPENEIEIKDNEVGRENKLYETDIDNIY